MKKDTVYYGYLEKLGVISRAYCDSEENAALQAIPISERPDNVFYDPDSNNYWRYPNLPDSEIQNKIAVISAIKLNTIKNWVMFFGVMSVIGILIAIFSWLSALTALT